MRQKKLPESAELTLIRVGFALLTKVQGMQEKEIKKLQEDIAALKRKLVNPSRKMKR